jgi:hypothetical protein
MGWWGRAKKRAGAFTFSSEFIFKAYRMLMKLIHHININNKHSSRFEMHQY